MQIENVALALDTGRDLHCSMPEIKKGWKSPMGIKILDTK